MSPYRREPKHGGRTFASTTTASRSNVVVVSPAKGTLVTAKSRTSGKKPHRKGQGAVTSDNVLIQAHPSKKALVSNGEPIMSVQEVRLLNAPHDTQCTWFCVAGPYVFRGTRNGRLECIRPALTAMDKDELVDAWPRDGKALPMGCAVLSGSASCLAEGVVDLVVSVGPVTYPNEGPLEVEIESNDSLPAYATFHLGFMSNNFAELHVQKGSSGFLTCSRTMSICRLRDGTSFLHAIIWKVRHSDVSHRRVSLLSDPLEPIRSAAVTGSYIIIVKASCIQTFSVAQIQDARDGDSIAPLHSEKVARPAWSADIAPRQAIFQTLYYLRSNAQGKDTSLSVEVIVRDHNGLTLYHVSCQSEETISVTNVSEMAITDDAYITALKFVPNRNAVVWVEHALEDVFDEMEPAGSSVKYALFRRAKLGRWPMGPSSSVLVDNGPHVVLNLCDEIQINGMTQRILLYQKYSRLAIDMAYSYQGSSNQPLDASKTFDIQAMDERLVPSDLLLEDITGSDDLVWSLRCHEAGGYCLPRRPEAISKGIVKLPKKWLCPPPEPDVKHFYSHLDGGAHVSRRLLELQAEPFLLASTDNHMEYLMLLYVNGWRLATFVDNSASTDAIQLQYAIDRFSGGIPQLVEPSPVESSAWLSDPFGRCNIDNMWRDEIRRRLSERLRDGEDWRALVALFGLWMAN